MMLLTDEEIHEDYKALRGDKQPRYVEIYRAAEAATLAKLASAELPEPTVYSYNARTHMNVLDAYTADQLRQAYAQGAAAQLAEKPESYGCRTADGVVRDCIGPDGVMDNETQYTVQLYTRRQAND